MLNSVAAYACRYYRIEHEELMLRSEKELAGLDGVFVPAGRFDISPAIYCWESTPFDSRPVGTLEPSLANRFKRPDRTRGLFTRTRR